MIIQAEAALPYRGQRTRRLHEKMTSAFARVLERRYATEAELAQALADAAIGVLGGASVQNAARDRIILESGGRPHC